MGPLSSAGMPRRSPARYLAPLAIVAFLVALGAIVSSSREEETTASRAGDATAEPTSAREEASEPARPRRRSTRRTYTVRPGDTPSAIAERTGIALEQLEALNPDIDPQQLSPGQRLRLRR